MVSSQENMNSSIPDILARIVEYKKADLDCAMVKRSELEALGAETRHSRRDFRKALSSRDVAIIAEIKKASPSKGVLANGIDPAALARIYEQGGAAALSVLTDEQFFHGSLDDMADARGAVDVPVLRKDFTFDEFHVAESAAYCADAILLIASILSAKRLRHLREYAARFGMASLVEVHDEAELDAAIESGAQIIGVNNRNLRTFEVTIETSLRLAPRIPAGVIKVSESGIRSAEDIRTLRQAGYSGFLIGEHLMKSRDPLGALRALLR